ncbi:hypothetical protein CEXT_24231 [Caerostris extrusa]|uniref:Uncharacterized protein n=1 Tax=Caerostris extrusa TaxID=172846 RepID=A0AAV4SKQ8_CAEEX|nr:hypothetical protein CEXT_24231 [Caerostris extrusa]
MNNESHRASPPNISHIPRPLWNCSEELPHSPLCLMCEKAFFGKHNYPSLVGKVLSGVNRSSKVREWCLFSAFLSSLSGLYCTVVKPSNDGLHLILFLK